MTPHTSNPSAAMLAKTVQGDDNRPVSLSTMPPEVAINIFCQLPSFSDVFALSAVCLRLRHLWLENVNPIYKQIGPRSIPCERAARRFLVGPGMEFPMTAKDVIRMVQNASVIEDTILQFEREVLMSENSELNSNVRIVRRVELRFQWISIAYMGLKTSMSRARESNLRDSRAQNGHISFVTTTPSRV